MHRCNTASTKIPSNLWVIWEGSISFQEISYAGKPQVVSRYILSNLWQKMWKSMHCTSCTAVTVESDIITNGRNISIWTKIVFWLLQISPLLRFINLPEKDIKVTFIFFRSDMKLIFSLRILSFLSLGSSLKRSLSFKDSCNQVLSFC